MGSRTNMDYGTNIGVNEWPYGCEVQCFYSDIEYVPGTRATTKDHQNRPDDNIRVQIVEKVNYGSKRKYASPMAKTIVEEEVKLPPFQVPPWLGVVPLVGWAFEGLVNLIMLPFSGLISNILSN